MFLGKGKEFLKKVAKIMKKYVKAYATQCPNCDEWVDTLIISKGRIMCPVCQKKNILDGFSMLAKMPEGKKKVHAVFCRVDKEHPENNVEVVGPQITDEKKGTKAFGYIKIPISNKLLTEKNVETFLEEYMIMAVLADKPLYEKVFGATIAIKGETKEVKKEDIN